MIMNNLLAELKLKRFVLSYAVVIALCWEFIFIGLAFSKEVSAQKEGTSKQGTQVKADEGSKSDKEIVPSFPVFEVKRLDTKEPRYSIELRNVELGDLFRTFAYNYKLNLLIDKRVKGSVTASFTNISLEEALQRIAQMNNLTLKKEGDVTIVKPNLVTRMFVLRYVKADELLGLSKEDQGQGKQGKQDKSKEKAATVYDLLSPEGKILLGPQSNSIVVIDYPPNVEEVKNFLMAVDQRMSREAFKLKYLSVKDLFPGLVDEERNKRKEQMEEREQESDEIKGIKGTTGTGN